jgi:osmotically-inducible protein OsmY
MMNGAGRTDDELKTDVLAELKYEPTVRVTDIGVLVKDGAVTLNGFATSYGEKSDAVRAVKRIAGVKAIADDIEVRLPDSGQRTDGDIAVAAANQINCSPAIPAGAVDVTVSKGRITLEGELQWYHEKTAAETAVQHLQGVTGVTNLIRIKPKLATAEVETAIRSAFKRNALLESNKIQVVTSGNKVILRGTVRNYAEREEAERATWAAPGVFSVDNRILVEWSDQGDHAKHSSARP